jgi:hypothetical protein
MAVGHGREIQAEQKMDSLEFASRMATQELQLVKAGQFSARQMADRHGLAKQVGREIRSMRFPLPT